MLKLFIKVFIKRYDEHAQTHQQTPFVCHFLFDDMSQVTEENLKTPTSYLKVVIGTFLNFQMLLCSHYVAITHKSLHE